MLLNPPVGMRLEPATNLPPPRRPTRTAGWSATPQAQTYYFLTPSQSTARAVQPDRSGPGERDAGGRHPSRQPVCEPAGLGRECGGRPGRVQAVADCSKWTPLCNSGCRALMKRGTHSISREIHTTLVASSGNHDRECTCVMSPREGGGERRDIKIGLCS